MCCATVLAVSDGLCIAIVLASTCQLRLAFLFTHAEPAQRSICILPAVEVQTDTLCTLIMHRRVHPHDLRRCMQHPNTTGTFCACSCSNALTAPCLPCLLGGGRGCISWCNPPSAICTMKGIHKRHSCGISCFSPCLCLWHPMQTCPDITMTKAVVLNGNQNEQPSTPTTTLSTSQKFRYQIKVVRTGTVAGTAGPYTITDTLPTGFALDTASGNPSITGPVTSSTCSTSSLPVTCTFTFSSAGTATISIPAIASATPGNSIENQVKLYKGPSSTGSPCSNAAVAVNVVRQCCCKHHARWRKAVFVQEMHHLHSVFAANPLFWSFTWLRRSRVNVLVTVSPR